VYKFLDIVKTSLKPLKYTTFGNWIHWKWYSEARIAVPAPEHSK